MLVPLFLLAFIYSNVCFSGVAGYPLTLHQRDTTTSNGSNSAPLVTLSYGQFQGKVTGNLNQFLGIPFAAPPIGNLRFAPPQPPLSLSTKGVQQATEFGAACFQQFPQGFVDDLISHGVILNFSSTPAPPGPPKISEDCLTINVVAPNNLSPGQKVPVVFWMYGGGFQFGDASVNPGDTMVSRSIDTDAPIIFVSANYRINAFGFLGGQQVKDAKIANAGLRDQRFAMQWIQDNISLFGGDNKRVTMMGSSAGAISAGLHLVVNNGDPAGLFQGAFMISGFAMALHDTSHQQPFFDQLLVNTNCTRSKDPIACLRSVSFEALGNAVNMSPGFFSFSSVQLSWPPSVDGDFLVGDPQVAIRNGSYARVPIVAGDCDDEGTVFSISNTNISTDDQFLQYMKTNYFENVASGDQLNAIVAAYPSNLTVGSPFDTGMSNAITPQFKRLAAIQGDLEFHAPRRLMLQATAQTQPTYSYLYKRGKGALLFGAQHGSDVNEWFGVGNNPDFVGTDALVNFVNTGNPNTQPGATTTTTSSNGIINQIVWPEYNADLKNPPLYTFLDGGNTTTTTDTFRAAGIQQLIDMYLKIGTK